MKKLVLCGVLLCVSAMVNSLVRAQENQCPVSDMTPTVVIDGCDSGVENHVIDNGCSISDLIGQCAANAENHGQFTSCVAHLLNELKADGIIRGADKGSIQSCAAQADIPSDVPFPTFNYYVDPADSRLLRIVDVDGSITEYFGERAPSGEAIGLTAVRRVEPDGAESWVYVDPVGRPTRLLPAGGFTFDFNWTGEEQFVLSVLTPNGDGQANVSLDLNDLPEVGEPSAAASAGVVPMRSGVRPPIPVESESSLPDVSAAAFGMATVNITVQRCGAPENDANVVVSVDGSTLTATRVGDGVYQVTLPTEVVDPSSFGSICSSITGVINNSCVFFDNLPPAAVASICASAAAPFVATPLPGVDEAVVFAACTAGIAAGKLYCATFGQSPAPGAPSVSDVVCAAVDAALDWALEPEVSLSARASVPGAGTSSSAVVEAPASGPFPDLAIDAGGEVEISSFTSSPVDPAPFQGYVATAGIVCAPPGTSVTVSIVGTDGYADSTTCTVSGEDTCSLSVPGAEEGIIDTVTVSIAGGPSRQIVLVF